MHTLFSKVAKRSSNPQSSVIRSTNFLMLIGDFDFHVIFTPLPFSRAIGYFLSHERIKVPDMQLSVTRSINRHPQVLKLTEAM